ncbi:MAG: signal peptidase I [Oscillospiraceae bacterium]|nr:signal peptidase I [Oscillospiraceae bacterium]
MQQSRAVRSLYEWMGVAVGSLVAVAIIFLFFFRVVGVDGQSMENTLQNHDRLVLYRFVYTPQFGDIVVINRYNAEPLIKRVIGVAGDKLEFDGTGVIRNGVPLSEPYVLGYTKAHETVTVPAGTVFVMGDNRLNSHDSRYADIGFVPVQDIVGKAVVRFFPLQEFTVFK